MPDESKTHQVFADPETQARHERNLEWLRLMKEDPGWALSRLHRLTDLEEQLEAAGVEYVCAHDHKWHTLGLPTRCPMCGTSTFKASSPAREPESA